MAFGAIRVQSIVVCLGAEPGSEDAGGVEPGAHQLIVISALEIEQRSISVARLEPGLDRIGSGVRGAGAKRFHDVGSDFAAALPETRTNGGHQVGGLAVEFAHHGPHAGSRSAGRGPAPTGVHGTDGSAARVEQQHRRAIGDADADGHIRIVSDDDVGFRPHPGDGPAATGDRGLNPVHLFHQQQPIGRHTERGGDRRPLPLIVSQLQIA